VFHPTSSVLLWKFFSHAAINTLRQEYPQLSMHQGFRHRSSLSTIRVGLQPAVLCRAHERWRRY